MEKKKYISRKISESNNFKLIFLIKIVAFCEFLLKVDFAPRDSEYMKLDRAVNFENGARTKKFEKRCVKEGVKRSSGTLLELDQSSVEFFLKSNISQKRDNWSRWNEIFVKS